MNLTPTPAFMEAIRQIAGATDLVPSPAVVFAALPSDGLEILQRHAEIVVFTGVVGRELQRVLCLVEVLCHQLARSRWLLGFDGVHNGLVRIYYLLNLCQRRPTTQTGAN